MTKEGQPTQVFETFPPSLSSEKKPQTFRSAQVPTKDLEELIRKGEVIENNLNVFENPKKPEIIERKRDIRVLLLYPPIQLDKDETARPDGSLGLLYIAGAVRDQGIDVKAIDCTVGTVKDSLADTFRNPRELDSGLFKIGMSDERLAEEIAQADVIGVTSIFTPQTKMVWHLAEIINEVNPQALKVIGGVNARSRPDWFLDKFDVIALSEGEKAIVDLVDAFRVVGKAPDYSQIPGIIYQDGDTVRINPQVNIVENLDELPLPAWDKLPLQKYAEVKHYHGGYWSDGEEVVFSSIQTSRGCPYQCGYCHISMEKGPINPDALSGGIGRYRMKSVERVREEIGILKNLGIERLFFEDDSLLANLKRVREIFYATKEFGLELADVNGVNLAHLFKNDQGKIVVNQELLELMVEVGFTNLVLPFESATQRMLDNWATNKWRRKTHDVHALVRACVKLGMRVPGNFMIGFPDETYEEMEETIKMAKELIDDGLTYATFFIPVPFPGSRMYHYAIANGHLEPDFDPDIMKWSKPIMKNTIIDSDYLAQRREEAWHEVNTEEYKAWKGSVSVASLTQEKK